LNLGTYTRLWLSTTDVVWPFTIFRDYMITLWLVYWLFLLFFLLHAFQFISLKTLLNKNKNEKGYQILIIWYQLYTYTHIYIYIDIFMNIDIRIRNTEHSFFIQNKHYILWSVKVLINMYNHMSIYPNGKYYVYIKQKFNNEI